MYAVFVFWFAATTVVLLTPRETVRRASESVAGHPSVQAHKGGMAYRALSDSGNWHMFWFFGLAMSATMLPRRLSGRSGSVCFAALFGYSFASELLQELLVPGRAFAWRDIGFNGAGIVFGVALVAVLRCWLGFRARQKES